MSVGRVARGPIEGSRDRERIRTVIVRDHDELAVLIADRVVEVIRRSVADKGRCVLGLAAGSTPLGIYRELVARHRRGDVSFARVVTARRLRRRTGSDCRSTMQWRRL
ncbi:MAG TPA: hypothetical protein VNL18_03640 [Gemmatimonadales bacterium]|nr:hypothetical protein [Gemmatimonadales bacterium]